MSRHYQLSDGHIVDYKLFTLPGVQGYFRGPAPRADQYVACVGASQTFGRFVQSPFPHLISHSLEIEVLNLGRGGIGAEYFLEDSVMQHINRAQIVIVQVLSGRSQSNSLFRIANQGMCGVNLVTGLEQRADEFYLWLQEQEIGLAQKVVAETRNNYVLAMARLLAAIKPPKILFWFSERSPDCQDRWELPKRQLCGKFPQFVNREMMDQLVGHADVYLECVSKRGLPQPLFDRSGAPAQFRGADGEIKMSNSYYPSPEMHEDAAELLVPACQSLLHRSPVGTAASVLAAKLPAATA